MPRTHATAANPRAETRDPRRMAVEAVEQWFESLTADADAHTHGHVCAVSLEEAFYEVRRALEAEYLREFKFSTAHQSDLITEHQIIATNAGYLIGVQVGLRLRGGR